MPLFVVLAELFSKSCFSFEVLDFKNNVYFKKNSEEINERKFQKALQVIERIAAMGVTNTEELPYYKIN